MTFSLRISEDESVLIKKYAEMNNMSVSEFFRQAAIERIEDEYDLQVYNQAIAEYRKNPVTYSHKEVREMLGLD